ncbi:MAG: ABC transporter permease [Acidobacteria bacterium]|nr:ABC transporter permease [Acidobacteriota bacterium]
MSLAIYLLRRALVALLLVWLAASAAFVLTRLSPGEFTPDDEGYRSPEQRAEVRRELGYDRPLAVQYVQWLGGAVRFDFGRSMLYRRPVNDLLAERAANTAILATAALVLATLIGLPLGVWSGSHSRGGVARVVRALSLFVLSVPPLVASLVLVLIAARTGWVPVGSMTSVDARDLSWAGWIADVLGHLGLPALALALPLGATLERLQSQAIADALGESFVRASLARGVSRPQAVWRHAWPVSLRPVLGLYGLIIGGLFSGSFIVEVVTAWPGLGRLMFDALRARDLYLVAGGAAAGAVSLGAATFVADALLATLDPRVRLGSAS